VWEVNSGVKITPPF